VESFTKNGKINSLSLSTGVLVSGVSWEEGEELGGAEASYAVSGGGGPNGVCGSSGVPLVRAGCRCGQTRRQTALRGY
jgi:hypothetical protein